MNDDEAIDAPHSLEELSGKSALVIGGSGGIGAAVCRTLHRCGCSLTVHGGSSRARLDRLLGDLTSISSAGGGGESSGTENLARSPTGFLRSIDTAEDTVDIVPSGGVDILVVAYGPIAWCGIEDSSPETWRRMVSTNLSVPGALASSCLPHMRSSGFGRIVFFGASAGDQLRPSQEAPAYTAAKAGLSSLARSIAARYAPDGITCNVVCPGYVDSEYIDDHTRKRFLRRAPGNRLQSPNEIAALVGFLCRNPSINGATINSGSGLT